MTLSTKVGSFNTGTGAVSSTVQVSDVGFQPSFVIFWWTKSTTTGTTDEVVGNHLSSGIGFAVSDTNRCCMAIQSEDASASADTDDVWYNNAVITIRTITGAADGVLDVQSMDTGGFTLVVDDQFTASYHIHYMAFGGTDITNATTGVKAVPGSSGDDPTTGLGFQPSIVFFLGDTSTTNATNNTSASLGFGAATSSTSRRVNLINMVHGEQTMEAASYSYDAQCLAIGSTTAPTAITARADFVSMDVGGFTINWSAVGSSRSYAYLAVKGGNWTIGDLLTQTDTTTDIVESGFGYQPSGALFVSHCNTKSTVNTAQSHTSLSIGAFNSTSSRGAQASYMEDATTDSECTYAVEHDAVYINISNADAVQGLMDIKSVDSGGFTCIMDDADPSQTYVWYVAVGPVPAGNNYTYTVTTTEAISDSISKSVGRIKLLVTTEAISDSTSKIGTFTKLLSTTEAISDSLSKVGTFFKSLSDSLGITDLLSKSAGRFATLANSVSITDTISTFVTKIVTLISTVGITDSISKILTAVRTFLETVGITDSIFKIGAFIKSITDTSGITDSVSKVYTGIRNLTDNIGITDSVTRVLVKIIAFSDTVGITDLLTRVLMSVRSLTENVGITDLTTKIGTFVKSLTESVGISDSISKSAQFIKSISNSVGITDLLSYIKSGANELFASIADSVGITDSISKIGTFIKSISNTVNITDSINKIGAFIKSITNTVGITDVLSRTVNKVISVSSTLGITDTISTLVAIFVSISDTVGITSILNRIHSVVIQLSNTVQINDLLTKIGQYIRTINITETFSDTIAKSANYIKSLTDTSNITDIVTGIKAIFVSLSDIVNITDLVNYIKEFANIVRRLYSIPNDSISGRGSVRTVSNRVVTRIRKLINSNRVTR